MRQLYNKPFPGRGGSPCSGSGAGGVGSFAIQLAKWKGAKVIATARAPNHDFLRQLGADEVIDYQNQKFEELVHDVDVVLDSIGGETQVNSFKVLKKDGILVSIVGRPSPSYCARPRTSIQRHSPVCAC